MSEMYGVDFDDESSEFEIKSRKILGEAITPSMITFLKKIGLARNDSQALTILMIVIIAAGATAYFIARPTQNTTIITQDGREISVEAYMQGLENGIDLTKE